MFMLLAAAAALTGVLPAAAASRSAGGADAAIHLRVFDLAQLPDATHAVIEKTAAAALAPVLVEWTRCPDTHPRPAACSVRRPPDVVVRIVEQHADEAAARCGFALPDPGTGGFISLAQGCAARAVASLAKNPKMKRLEPVTEGHVLGYMLAHEIAHILLPDAPHTSDGLFKRRLTRHDWARLREGALTFRAEDLARMQNTVEKITAAHPAVAHAKRRDRER